MGEEQMSYDQLIASLEALGESGSDDGFYEGEEEMDDGPEQYLLGYGAQSMNPYAEEDDQSTVPVGAVDTGNIEDEVPDYITDADIEKYASVIYPETKVVHSLLLEVFTPEQLLEFEKLRRNLTLSNNRKTVEVKRLLTEWGKTWSPLGPGTNRYGMTIDGYVIKVALDADGEIDNRREFIYSMQLYPYVIKCYECLPNGLCAVFEYVEVFSLDDYHKYQDEMRKILTDIASSFLIGDVGISSVNYLNWGHRGSTDQICILDFAYIYSVKFKTFTCQCSVSSILHYDNDFNNLICPKCGKKYAFKDIRKKISRADQEAEIGDIRQKGYTISSSYQEVPFNPNFTDGARDRIYEELLKIKKKRDKKLSLKASNPSYDPSDGMDDDEIVKAIKNGSLSV